MKLTYWIDDTDVECLEFDIENFDEEDDADEIEATKKLLDFIFDKINNPSECNSLEELKAAIDELDNFNLYHTIHFCGNYIDITMGLN